MCATLTIDTSYSVNGAKGRITLDYGSSNCLSIIDGRFRRGKIYIDYSGKYRTPGTKVTTTFDGFYVNNNLIEGTIVVETVTREEYNVTVTNAKITYTDATTTTWESVRTRIWTEGNGTDFADLIYIFNDVYEISGTASGVGRTGIEIRLECWKSLIFHPVSGSITVSPDGFQDRILDYGDGTCDKKGTITVGSTVVEYDFAQ